MIPISMSASKDVLDEAGRKKNYRKEYQTTMYREKIRYIKEIAHLLLPEIQCRGETRDLLAGIRHVFENKFPEKIGKENGVLFRRTVQFDGIRQSIWATADFSKNYELFLEKREEREAVRLRFMINEDLEGNTVHEQAEVPRVDEMTQFVNYHIDEWELPHALEAQLGPLHHTPSPIDFDANHPVPTPYMNPVNYGFEAVQVDRGNQNLTGHLQPSPPMNAYSHSALSAFHPPTVDGMMRQGNVDAYANQNFGGLPADPTLLQIYSPGPAFGHFDPIHEDTLFRF